MTRWFGAVLVLWSSLLCAADLPGIWIEAEQSAPGIFGVPSSSGGANARVQRVGDQWAVPMNVPMAIAKSRLFLRYSNPNPNPTKLRLSIEGADPKAGRKPLMDVNLPPTGAMWRQVWKAWPAPALEAGEHKLVIETVEFGGLVDIDVLVFVDRSTHNTWRPPNEGKDGKLIGTGIAGGPVQIAGSEFRSTIAIFYGDEVVGEGKAAQLDVRFVNMQSDAADVATSIRFQSEHGEAVSVPGPRVSLKADEEKVETLSIRPPDYGWFDVTVSAGEGPAAETTNLQIGVIRRPVEGVRPDSMFGLNIGAAENDLVSGRMIGVKWRRGLPISFGPTTVAPARGKWWTDDQIPRYRQAIKKWKDAGILTVGEQNYNAEWNVAPSKDGKPLQVFQNRPADLSVQAEICYRMFKAFRDDITYWEIWNEPWVAGWTWQTGTAQDYREMSRLIWERVKPDLPEIMLIGGGSTSYQRDILFAPGNQSMGYAEGCATHPYGAPDRTMPSSAAVESVLMKKHAKSGGKAGIWATEIGAPEFGFESEPVDRRKFSAARALAPMYLLNRIGAEDTPMRAFYFCSFYGNTENPFNIWNDTHPKPALVAYSAMTHFLEDGKLQADLFNSSTALWAPHFVKPDGSSVVAFWAEEGFSGRLILPGGVFQAYDYLGATTGKVEGDKLAIDFVRWGTVYLVSKQPADQVRAAMAAATFQAMPALRINPRSFAKSVDQLPVLQVKVQNLLPAAVDGELTIDPPAEIQLGERTRKIASLKSGEIRYLDFPLAKATANAVNRYKIDYTAVVGGQMQKGSQVVQSALASFGTPTIDGKLDDWAGVTPVTMVSRGAKDFTEAALNPDKAAAILAQKQLGDTVAYRVWTRWDDTHFYFAAEVPNAEQKLRTSSSDDFPWECDGVQLAFDCLEPNPDDFFVNHPSREKWLGSEVDYEFAAVQGAAAGEIHRLKAPGTNYQTLYDTNVPTNPPLGVMSDGKVVTTYDAEQKLTRYEVAVPWASIKELGDRVKSLKAGESVSTHFAFSVNDVGGRGKTFWTQEAGDLQSGAYGFSPTWQGGSTRAGGRILTDWTFVR